MYRPPGESVLFDISVNYDFFSSLRSLDQKIIVDRRVKKYTLPACAPTSHPEGASVATNAHQSPARLGFRGPKHHDTLLFL